MSFRQWLVVAVILGVVALGVFLNLDFFHFIFSVDGFEPHSSHFYPDNVGLMWFIVFSNALTVLAYTLIPITLVYIVRKRKDLVYNWIFLLFGLFIILCGVTHALRIIIFWYPVYWLEGVVGVITALASFVTFFALLIAIPQIVKLTSPKQMEEVGAKLAKEIQEHKNTEDDLVRRNRSIESTNREILLKSEELANLNKFMIGRESRIAELQAEIEKINKRHG